MVMMLAIMMMMMVIMMKTVSVMMIKIAMKRMLEMTTKLMAMRVLMMKMKMTIVMMMANACYLDNDSDDNLIISIMMKILIERTGGWEGCLPMKRCFPGSQMDPEEKEMLPGLFLATT